MRSFPFFAKERSVLSILFKRTLRSFRSLEKNGKERSVLCGPISRQKLEKRTEKNVTFFFLNGKERNVPHGKERKRTECPTLPEYLVTTKMDLTSKSYLFPKALIGFKGLSHLMFKLNTPPLGSVN